MMCLLETCRLHMFRTKYICNMFPIYVCSNIFGFHLYFTTDICSHLVCTASGNMCGYFSTLLLCSSAAVNTKSTNSIITILRCNYVTTHFNWIHCTMWSPLVVALTLTFYASVHVCQPHVITSKTLAKFALVIF